MSKSRNLMSAANKKRRRRAKWIESKGICFYCKVKMHFDGADDGTKMTLDHLIPISKGGDDKLSNLVAACKKCNGKRGDKEIAEFVNIKKCKCSNPIIKRRAANRYTCSVCNCRYLFKEAA